MEPLATLPLFFKLAGKRVVLIGTSDAAQWKADLLSATGAELSLYATWSEATTNGKPHEPRAWRANDLAGAALAVAAIEDDAEAAAFVAAAQAHGVPFNVVDRPTFCQFQFGAIVNRSPLVIGISTDGAAPVFGQAIRADIEGLLPRGLKRWAEAAKAWRGSVQALKLDFAGRRQFWERFTALARSSPERVPATTDRDTLLADVRMPHDAARNGRVALVGAGPGDPELLTLAAVRALRSAEVILYDDLVAPEILDFARRESKRMLVGKTGHGPSCRQDDINQTMIAFAQAGRRVVRLKSGDPLLFGRAAEEMTALDAAGIDYEIIPGITTAQGAAARLRVPLTERTVARRLQFVTGHGRDGRLPDDLDLRAIADTSTTTAVYMPQRTLALLCARVIDAGAEATTPVLAVFNATRRDEAVVGGTLSDIAAQVSAAAHPGPCLLLIGAATRSALATPHQHDSLSAWA